MTTPLEVLNDQAIALEVAAGHSQEEARKCERQAERLLAQAQALRNAIEAINEHCNLPASVAVATPAQAKSKQTGSGNGHQIGTTAAIMGYLAEHGLGTPAEIADAIEDKISTAAVNRRHMIQTTLFNLYRRKKIRKVGIHYGVLKKEQPE